MTKFVIAAVLFCAFITLPPGPGAAYAADGQYSLQSCIDMAVTNNSQRAASAESQAIAEAQYRQAISSYWPQVHVSSVYSLQDKAPRFVFPQETSTYSLSGLDVLGLPGLPPGTVLPVGVTVPQKRVKLMDPSNLDNVAELTWPLYTGGRREAAVRQAEAGKGLARQAARRTDLDLVSDVRSRYYAVVLTRSLLKVGHDTVARMEATLDLTERLWRDGSDKVKKTDYLKNKLMVDTIRSVVAELEYNAEMANAALVNTMGLPWNRRVEVAETAIPFSPTKAELPNLVADAYEISIDMKSIELGRQGLEAQRDQAMGEFLPTVGMFARVKATVNSYNAGMVSDSDKLTSVVGVGLDLPIFDGFRTVNKVRESEARLRKLGHEKLLLKEGLALRLKDQFLSIKRAEKQVETTGAALDTATENRSLTERAYREGLIETKEVIEAQLFESMTEARHLKSLFDHYDASVRIDQIVGAEILERL